MSTSLPVRLIICVDGTWDTSEGSFNALKGAIGGTVDSIKSISNMIKNGIVEDSTGKKFDQHAHYLQGVGTQDVTASNVDFPGMHLIVRANSTFQGATGYGIVTHRSGLKDQFPKGLIRVGAIGYLDILKKAYRICCDELQQGDKDEIYMFGFSRGAFIVRALASMLEYVGMIKSEHMLTDIEFESKFYELLRRYSVLYQKSRIITPTDPTKNLLNFCKPSPRIRFIGVFDTVKAVLQLPLTNTFAHGIPIIDFDLDAPYLVDNFRHALALNEGRPAFGPTYWKREGKSPDSNYQEAWFFGYHHDIGGGNDHQGLALWPLQWILHAATDAGLVLDSGLEYYNILFSGGNNVIDTPHELAMKMFDMIHHHSGTSEKFKLLLNETSWGFLDQPRNYFSLLTSPPYVQRTKPRVFLHPSAYLLFDVSTTFRLQIYEWKYFRTFVRERFGSIPQVVLPWWENQTVKSILRENSAVRHMRVLVYGPPGAEKSSLISRTFGKWVKGAPTAAGGAADISEPVSIPENRLIRLHYSDGFGKGGTDTFESVEKFMALYKEKTDPENALHAIWYCIDCTEGETADSEKKFSTLDFGDIPVMVVLTNEEELKKKIRSDLTKEFIFDEKKVEERFNEIIAKKQEDLKALPARSYVNVGSAVNSVKNLLSETYRNLKDTAVQLTQTKAQRISVTPKIALATEESVRAYAIWHSFKFEGKEIVFRPQMDTSSGKTLTQILMEPVLETFNVRFPNDDTMIRSKIGSPWSDLDKYAAKPGLWDKKIPGSMILLCMVDTILVMARALSRQSIFEKPLAGLGLAGPLNSAAIELACAWYVFGANSTQKAVHLRILSILSEQDWSPKDKSMASLQMRLVDTVEFGSESVGDFLENIQGAVVGGTKKVVVGVGSSIGAGISVGIGGVGAGIGAGLGGLGGIRRGFR